MQNDKIKNLCWELQKIVANGAHFNYVFDKTLVMGAVMDASRYGIHAGIDNNIIGSQSECANLFYAHILLYAAQIKEVLNYSSEKLVNELIRRLKKDEAAFDTIPAVINFKLKTLQPGGSNERN